MHRKEVERINVNVYIEGSPAELAALALQLQERQVLKTDADEIYAEFSRRAEQDQASE